MVGLAFLVLAAVWFVGVFFAFDYVTAPEDSFIWPWLMFVFICKWIDQNVPVYPFGRGTRKIAGLN